MRKVVNFMKKALILAVKVFIIAAYLAMITVLVVQALTPGSESSDISQDFGDRLDDVITEIKPPETTTVAVTGVKIESVTVSGKTNKGDEIEILLGSSGKINGKASPADATNPAISYTSSDESVVAVYSDGRITAKSVGTATVTIASRENPSLTDSVTVVVSAVAIEGIDITPLDESISVGEKRKLELQFSPKNTTDKSVSWHSSDTSVLTVDKSGTVTAVSEGEATVTVISSVNEEIFATVRITVEPKKEEPKIPVESVSINASGQVGYIGSTLKLEAVLSPAGATGSVTWYSSDESVATVSQKGVITAHKAGTVTITAKCGDLSSSVTITVKEVLSENIHLEFKDISHTDEGGYTIKQGESGKIIATLDENATVLDITYSSSNEAVAKISPDGVIEALKGGSTTITVSTSYEGKTTEVSFELTVDPLTLKDTVENFYYWVRKSMGHFGAFLVLGIFAALSYYIIFKKTLKGKLIAFAVTIFAGFAVAGITEILQLPYFTQGRRSEEHTSELQSR